MTPTTPLDYIPTPSELKEIQDAGYTVKKHADGLYYLIFPNDPGPFPGYETERYAWALAWRIVVSKKEWQDYREYVRTHIVTADGTFEVEKA